MLLFFFYFATLVSKVLLLSFMVIVISQADISFGFLLSEVSMIRGHFHHDDDYENNQTIVICVDWNWNL